MDKVSMRLSESVPRIDKLYPTLLGSSELCTSSQWSEVRNMKVSQNKSLLFHYLPCTDSSEYHGLLLCGESQVYGTTKIKWVWRKEDVIGLVKRCRSRFVFRRFRVLFSTRRPVTKAQGFLFGFTPWLFFVNETGLNSRNASLSISLRNRRQVKVFFRPLHEGI
jgi:hypothetical protein